MESSKIRRRFVVLAWSATVCAQFSARPLPAEDVDFEKHVAPILITRCLECHSELGASGGLVLTKSESLRKGGENGPAIQAGRPEESLLWQRVDAGEMPPEKHGRPQKLSDAERAVLRSWVAAGARWPAGRRLDLYERTTASRAGRDWWSLQPVQRPAVPVVDATQEIGRAHV